MAVGDLGIPRFHPHPHHHSDSGLGDCARSYHITSGAEIYDLICIARGKRMREDRSCFELAKEPRGIDTLDSSRYVRGKLEGTK